MASKIHALSLKIFLLGVCVFIGFLWGRQGIPIGASIDTSNDQQVRLGNGVYTNPLLECDAADGTINSNKTDFRQPLTDYVTQVSAEPTITSVAVDYRDLNNGPSFGVNRNNPFFPASLLKVPLMMTYYKHAEDDPSILIQGVTLTQDQMNGFGDVAQEIPPEKKLSVGQTYSINDLITHMIVYSDNMALQLLSQHIDESEYNNLYKLLGVDTNVVTDPAGQLSTQQYATFFRILYNASYLSQEDSEKALKLLTQTTFDNGLRQGVPQNISIAHKFGERESDGGSQLHDCGIIYYPKHPYLLCVMTKGGDFKNLEKVVGEVSKFVYGKVDEQYRGSK